MKIISDGTQAGTKILDDSGNLLSKVKSVHIDIAYDEVYAKCTMVVYVPTIDITIKDENVTEVIVKEEQERVY